METHTDDDTIIIPTKARIDEFLRQGVDVIEGQGWDEALDGLSSSDSGQTSVLTADAIIAAWDSIIPDDNDGSLSDPVECKLFGATMTTSLWVEVAPTQAVDQLTEEAQSRLSELAPFIGPDTASKLGDQVHDQAARIVAELHQTTDEPVANEALLTVMELCWPTGNVNDQWWGTTPLGRLCARSLAERDSDAVTHAVAAAMLGVARGTVAQLVHRGTLTRHPDGGVARSSVLERIANRPQRSR